MYLKYQNKDNIPDDYIAIFHGNINGQQTYKTYIYKKNNDHDNWGFKYITVTKKTNTNENSNEKYTITDEGEFDWTDGAF